ncbi:unnamed protein product [Paramecium primaurelia]|uniref:Uncharacterized protein n=1 Tax=Paramecium primaurelia TaxID=5886 RepID=A0A8S1MPG6_PARPR|nr:unnamed protein product [Paramecium primaurelia]
MSEGLKICQNVLLNKKMINFNIVFVLFQSHQIQQFLYYLKIMDIEVEENHQLMRTICCPSLRPLNKYIKKFLQLHSKISRKKIYNFFNLEK